MHTQWAARSRVVAPASPVLQQLQQPEVPAQWVLKLPSCPSFGGVSSSQILVRAVLQHQRRSSSPQPQRRSWWPRLAHTISTDHRGGTSAAVHSCTQHTAPPHLLRWSGCSTYSLVFLGLPTPVRLLLRCRAGRGMVATTAKTQRRSSCRPSNAEVPHHTPHGTRQQLAGEYCEPAPRRGSTDLLWQPGEHR